MLRELFIFLFVLVCFGGTSAQANSALLKVTPAPLVLDQKNLAQVWVLKDPQTGFFSFESKPVLTALRPILLDEVFLRLVQVESKDGLMSSEDFIREGIEFAFNEASIEILVKIPIGLRKINEVNLKKNGLLGRSLNSDVNSGYLNFRGLYSEQKANAQTTSTQQSDWQFVHNFNGLIFESWFLFNSNWQERSSRGDTRFILDFESNHRMILGDLDFQSYGYLESVKGAGLSVNSRRNKNLRNFSRLLSQARLEVDRNANLEIYANGLLVSSIRVAPGVLDLNSIPLVGGDNLIKLVVKDDLGKAEEHVLHKYVKADGLVKGEQEWEIAVLQPLAVSMPNRSYLGQNHLSGLYAFGISDHTSLGVGASYFQSKAFHQLDLNYANSQTEFELLVAKIQGGTSLSHEKSGAAKLSISSLTPGIKYSLIGESKGYHFTNNLISSALTPTVRNRVQLNVGNSFARQTSAQIGFERMYDYMNSEHRDSVKTQAGVRISTNSRLDAYWEVSSQGSQKDWSTFVNWTLFENRFYSHLALEQKGQNKSLNVSLSPDSLSHGYSLQADANSNPSSEGHSIAGEYYTRFGSFRSSFGQNQVDSMASTKRMDLGINSALAWSASDFAMSRPISDSFAILKIDGLGPQEKVAINPGSVQGAEKAYLVGEKSIVLPDLISYWPREISFDPSQLQQGAKLDVEFYQINPRYRSGVSVRNKVSKYLLVKGELLDSNGKALSYASGSILDSAGQIVNEDFFTNKSGQFVLEGLSAQKYILVLSGGRRVELDLQTYKSEKLQLILKQEAQK